MVQFLIPVQKGKHLQLLTDRLYKNIFIIALANMGI